MLIKKNITFSLEIKGKVTKKKRNDQLQLGNIPIRMRVTFNSSRIDFFTGYRTDADKWDAENQRATGMNQAMQTASEINDYLDYLKAEIIKVFHKYEFMEQMPTREQVKADFNERISQKSDENGYVDDIDKQVTAHEKNIFWDAFKEFIKVNGRQNDWTEATYEKFHAMRNHLKGLRERKRKLGLKTFDYDFDFFDEEGILSYIEYLRDVKNMKNTTVEKSLDFLRWFLRWSLHKGFHQNNCFETFRPKFKKTQKKVVFLTKAELEKLEKYKIPETKLYLYRVRDVFLFCCFTGLRHSDVYNLKRCDVKKDYIEVTTIKTYDSLRIELNDHSKAILEKYAQFSFPNDKALPVITNQKMNEYLHELCKLAGLNEPVRQTYYKGNERIDVVKPKYELVGTHTGRRTFICNALGMGISPQIVMKWTGHSDYKAMKPYIDVADEIKMEAMKKFNQFIE